MTETPDISPGLQAAAGKMSPGRRDNFLAIVAAVGKMNQGERDQFLAWLLWRQAPWYRRVWDRISRR